MLPESIHSVAACMPPLIHLDCLDDDAIKPVDSQAGFSTLSRRRTYQSHGAGSSAKMSLENMASSLFVLGGSQNQENYRRSESPSTRPTDLPYLSGEVTVGRNSQFHNLSSEDRLRLGGIEYRSLKLLLKIVSGKN